MSRGSQLEDSRRLEWQMQRPCGRNKHGCPKQQALRDWAREDRQPQGAWPQGVRPMGGPGWCPRGMTAFAESQAMRLMLSEPQATRSSLDELALVTEHLCGVI